MKSPPASLRSLSIVLLVGACLAPESIIPFAQAAGYGNCGCNQYGPYRGNYRYRRAGYSYGGTRYSVLRYSSYRQPFGSAHPRSLIGRYSLGRSYGYPYGGYSSSVITSRFGGYFPYRTSASAIRFGRSFSSRPFPRYRVRFGQSTVPGLRDSALGGFRFVSAKNLSENLVKRGGQAHFAPKTPQNEPVPGGFRFVSTKDAFDSIPADEGWILLSEGQPAEAVASFDKRISENPGNMTAKVGLALAFASAGDLTAGAWHMRQACSSDAGVLKVVLLNDELRHQIEHLIGNYKNSLSKHSADRQSHFMLAVLNYLHRDKDAAATSISHAIRNGDRTAVARHLQELIEDFDVDQQPALVQN